MKMANVLIHICAILCIVIQPQSSEMPNSITNRGGNFITSKELFSVGSVNLVGVYIWDQKGASVSSITVQTVLYSLDGVHSWVVRCTSLSIILLFKNTLADWWTGPSLVQHFLRVGLLGEVELYTLQRQYTENSKQIFPEMKLCGLNTIPIFMVLWAINISTIGLPILLQENMWTDHGNK